MDVVYNEFLNQFATQGIDLVNDSIYVALFPDTYVPDTDAHIFLDDISAGEVVGTGYVAGGVEVTGKVFTKQDSANNVKFDLDDVSWPASTIDAQYAVLYKNTGTPSTSNLIMAVDFGEVKSSSNGTFSITWSDDGVFTLSKAV